MVDDIKLEELEQADSSTARLALKKPDVSMCEHISANAEIVACNVNLTIGELFSLKVGDVLSANEDLDEPMTLIIEGKPVAVGNLVAVGDKFGFEITGIAD